MYQIHANLAFWPIFTHVYLECKPKILYIDYQAWLSWRFKFKLFELKTENFQSFVSVNRCILGIYWKVRKNTIMSTCACFTCSWNNHQVKTVILKWNPHTPSLAVPISKVLHNELGRKPYDVYYFEHISWSQ